MEQYVNLQKHLDRGSPGSALGEDIAAQTRLGEDIATQSSHSTNDSILCTRQTSYASLLNKRYTLC